MACSVWSARRRIARISASIVSSVLFSFVLNACDTPEQVSRDRDLDQYAVSYVLDSGPRGKAVDVARRSIRYHLEDGNPLAARGVALSHLEWIEEDPDMTDSATKAAERAEFERILLELDKEIAQIPVEALEEKAGKILSSLFRGEAIAYRYEVFTRAQTGLERGRAAAKICNEIVYDLYQRPPEADSSRLDKAFEYCEMAFDLLAGSTTEEDAKQLRNMFSALSGLWRVSGKPPYEFPYTEKMLPHLKPLEIEQQLQSLSYIQAAAALNAKRMDPAEFEEMSSGVAQLRYLMAKQIGNEKEMGLARLMKGASLERQGKFEEAARAYAGAKEHLAATGFLALNDRRVAMLEDLENFSKPGGPEAAAREAVSWAEESGDNARAAGAYEALALVLTRQEKLEEAAAAHSSMLGAARKTDDNKLTAHALVLASDKTGNSDHKTQIERLTEAANIYRRIGDPDGEARTLFQLSTLDAAAADVHRKRAFALLDQIGGDGLKAILHQMKALSDEKAKDFAAMRENGALCRKHWAAIEAREQVAHCEVLLAEAEKQSKNGEQSCIHLKNAHRNYVDLGMPGKVALQERKMKEQGCIAL